MTLPAPGERRDPASFFAPWRPSAVWLEIGFGGGEHLAAQAEAHREVGLIGAEVYENGVAKLLGEVETRGLGNVRILADDARPLLERLADASLARVFILFPDPWPKARQKKRRIVNEQTLDELARLMPSGAELRLATDIPDYLEAMLAVAAAHPGFVAARPPAEWHERPSDWPATRYEKKAIAAGRPPAFLSFRRR